jgi:hypothetical protein
VLLAAATLAGCGSAPTRDVRATIVDEEGAPIPEAVFYAEAYDDSGAFAFLSARAGQAGEVPDSAREPLKIGWRGGARIALAAFAPGRRPAVLRDPGGRIESDGAVLVLEPAAPLEGELAVAALAFPFEDDPLLAVLAAAPEHARLRRALREVYGALEASGARPLTPNEERKLRALEELERR